MFAIKLSKFRANASNSTYIPSKLVKNSKTSFALMRSKHRNILGLWKESGALTFFKKGYTAWKQYPSFPVADIQKLYGISRKIV